MRVITARGRPPDSTSRAGAASSIWTASSIVWPTPIVGRRRPITRSTGMSSTPGSRAIASIRSSSSTEPDTSALANGGVFLHTGSWLMPLAFIRATASRTGWPGLT